MEDYMLRQAESIVKKFHQEHLLSFYDELDNSQKNILLSQIISTDFEMINLLYQNSKKDDSVSPSEISPINYSIKSQISKTQFDLYNEIGATIIKNAELAIITLAGGQGTRLGYKGPKGSYEIDVPPKKSLFEFACEKVQNAYNLYHVYLPWYIMTSPSNDFQTKQFFKSHNYFNYPKEKITFFVQNTLPVIDTNGKIVLDSVYSIKTASNGNGDVFSSFNTANLVDSLSIQNIKWIFISGIDNIILDIVDPLFIGFTIANKACVSSKSIAKRNLSDKDWVFANVNGCPSIIDPSNFTEEMKYSRNSSDLYNYNQINILAHLFNIDSFNLLINKRLPYHRAFKKVDYINDEGMKVVPTEPNCFKFEKFIFDSFKYFNNIGLLEVNSEDEFAPIKSFTGNATPETALQLYLNKKGF